MSIIDSINKIDIAKNKIIINYLIIDKLMKRTLFFLMVLLSNASIGFSQSHFSVVWSGNGLDQMNVNVMSATLDGNPLQTGDEIAVFDGRYCVGVIL